MIVHFHQFDPYIKAPTSERRRDKRQELQRGLKALRSQGARLVWTLHNYAPHDGDSEAIAADLEMREFVLHNFSKVIVLNQAGREEALRTFPENMIAVIPHPSFQGVCGPAVDKAQARAKLKMPENRLVFGYLGGVAPYKGIELILDAFRNYHNPHASLVIAGRCRDHDYQRSLQKLATKGRPSRVSR